MTLLDRARRWIEEDPDPQTREELEALVTLAEHDIPEALAELGDRFSGALQFGTAGLRGELGAGPNRMNRVVVSRAAAGLAAYLIERGNADATVVIGYDARRLSDVFAVDTARILAGAGLRAKVLPSPAPTPVLAYAIRELGCVAGVMVTASHNPAEDNGYKVYDSGGSQIVSPADAEISAAIEGVGPLAEIAFADGWDILGEEIIDSYVERIGGMLAHGPRDLRVAYTPLHGVGGDVVRRVLERAGFAAPEVVAEQAEPNAAFPTTPFPNPEEPGAMDLVLGLGERIGADLVIASDPDADRCAAAVPTTGGVRRLSGDELGALLGEHLVRQGVEGTLATTIVSSTLLSKIAARHGREFVETLTGFKWLGRVPHLAFSYEEAIGYCVEPAAVADKDGISALLRLCELAAGLKAEGHTPLDLLGDLAREHGLHATEQLSMRVNDLNEIDRILQQLRDQPPSSLDEHGVDGVDDLSQPTDDLPATSGLRFRLNGGARVMVRPSGTEPKLKCYFEVVVGVAANAEGIAAAEAAARATLRVMRTELAQAAGIPEF